MEIQEVMNHENIVINTIWIQMESDDSLQHSLLMKTVS